MIFVTVGTTKFPFSRLFSALDNFLINSNSHEKLIVQSPLSYKFKYPYLQTFTDLPFTKIILYFKKSRINLVHGGITSILLAIKYGHSQPIVIPRYQKYSEHTNNNQVDFCHYIFSKIPAKYLFDSPDFFKNLKQSLTHPKHVQSKSINCSPLLLQKLNNYCLSNFSNKE